MGDIQNLHVTVKVQIKRAIKLLRSVVAAARRERPAPWLDRPLPLPTPLSAAYKVITATLYLVVMICSQTFITSSLPHSLSLQLSRGIERACVLPPFLSLHVIAPAIIKCRAEPEERKLKVSEEGQRNLGLNPSLFGGLWPLKPFAAFFLDQRPSLKGQRDGQSDELSESIPITAERGGGVACNLIFLQRRAPLEIDVGAMHHPNPPAHL